MLGQIAFSQNEIIEIEGAIVISDNDDQTPIAGTIRYSGQDFEGFDGTQWISLVCECDDDSEGPLCPDDRYVSHTVVNLTSSLVKLRVDLSQFLPMRLAYFPSSNPSQIQYSNCENSTTYDTHIQTVSGLSSATEYTFIVQASPNVGSSCNAMIWEEISCPIIITTI